MDRSLVQEVVRPTELSEFSSSKIEVTTISIIRVERVVR